MLMVGSLMLPIGSTRAVRLPTRAAPVSEAVRASGLPLRLSKLDDTVTPWRNAYDPETRHIHSHVLSAALISEFGSCVLNVPALVGRGMCFLVVVNDTMNCQLSERRLDTAVSIEWYCSLAFASFTIWTFWNADPARAAG